MKVNLQGNVSVRVTNAYAPTSSAENEKVEQFYDDIARTMADSDTKYIFIIRDSNAEIGTKTKEEYLERMGAFGIGKGRERGDHLVDFEEEQKLIIPNVLFQKPKADTGNGSHYMEEQETRQISL